MGCASRLLSEHLLSGEWRDRSARRDNRSRPDLSIAGSRLNQLPDHRVTGVSGGDGG